MTQGEQPYARTTPYELAIPQEVERDLFPRIREEAEARDRLPRTLDEFVSLRSAGSLLDDVVPARGEAGELSGDVVAQYARTLYHAFQFWIFGRKLLLLGEDAARALTLETGVPDAVVAPPFPAAYLQLPRNLFWVAAVEGAAPEPVDGLFWAMIGSGDTAVDPPFDRLDVLLVLGILPDRPGFSVVEVGVGLEEGAGVPPWILRPAREGDSDFANILPGGELKDLHSFVSGGEVLRFVGLVFHSIAGRHLVECESPEAPEEVAAGDRPTPPSVLRYLRIGPIRG